MTPTNVVPITHPATDASRGALADHHAAACAEGSANSAPPAGLGQGEWWPTLLSLKVDDVTIAPEADSIALTFPQSEADADRQQAATFLSLSAADALAGGLRYMVDSALRRHSSRSGLKADSETDADADVLRLASAAIAAEAEVDRLYDLVQDAATAPLRGAVDECRRLTEELASTPAVTLAGIRAKAAALVAGMGQDPDRPELVNWGPVELDGPVMRSIIRDLIGLPPARPTVQ